MATRVLLVACDAVEPRLIQPLIDAGKTPTLQRLLEQGASGSMLSAAPLVPAAQWTSVVTGKRPWQHRVCHQAELDPQLGRAIPVSGVRRHSAALWEILQRQGKKSLVICWPATHGSRAEEATIVSDRFAEATAGPGVKPWPPALPGTYWPGELAAVLDPLRVSPEDIQADLIAHFVPDWKTIDQKRDRRLNYLRLFLAADGSHHAAMMRLLQGNRWDFAAIHYPALGAITGMFLPFRSPRQTWVSEREFRLYQPVLPAAYVMLDRLLQSLVQAAGKEAVVILASAFGVSRHQPPRPPRAGEDELWKSPYGMLAVSGPGFKSESQIIGGTVLDVAPTILTWFGLAMGDDMEGRVLMESFVAAPEVIRVGSWDSEAVDAPKAVEVTTRSSASNPTGDRLGREYEWNLARSALEAGRYQEALPGLEQLFRSFPEGAEFGLALFQCQLTLKQTASAELTLEILLDSLPPGVESLLCRAEFLVVEGRRTEALPLVQEIQKLKPTEPAVLRRLGLILWRLREWQALADLAQAILKLDPDEPLAWLAQAEASLRQGRFSEALGAAQRAIQLNYFLPRAHLILSRALLNDGKWAEAREAMQVVLRLQPNNRAAAAYWRRSGLDKPE